MVSVLTCPVCGCDVQWAEQELLVTPSTTNDSGTGAVVFHCPQSHRFVTSLKESAAKASSALCVSSEIR